MMRVCEKLVRKVHNPDVAGVFFLANVTVLVVIMLVAIQIEPGRMRSALQLYALIHVIVAGLCLYLLLRHLDKPRWRIRAVWGICYGIGISGVAVGSVRLFTRWGESPLGSYIAALVIGLFLIIIGAKKASQVSNGEAHGGACQGK